MTIYTDDRKALLEYAEEMGDRQSALELVNNSAKHIDYIKQMEASKYGFKGEPEPEKQSIITKNVGLDYEPEF